MSRENVELIKATIEAFNRQDWDAFRAAHAPEFEADYSRATGPTMHGIYGLDEYLRRVAEFREHWESVRIEPHEFIETGDLVVVPWTMRVKGRDGIEVVAHPTMEFTIRAGAIQRHVMHQEREDALEAVGLSEQDAHADA
jgi:ketosteroid isomerase-like protein